MIATVDYYTAGNDIEVWTYTSTGNDIEVWTYTSTTASISKPAPRVIYITATQSDEVTVDEPFVQPKPYLNPFYVKPKVKKLRSQTYPKSVYLPFFRAKLRNNHLYTKRRSKERQRKIRLRNTHNG